MAAVPDPSTPFQAFRFPLVSCPSCAAEMFIGASWDQFVCGGCGRVLESL